MTTITILLSTYNGEKYLAQQLNSIVTQDFQDWQLIIRDDGSQDNTVKIIAEYQKKDSRIKLYQDQEGNLGANKSFRKLIAIAPESDYYTFSDQDDSWMPDKLTQIFKAANAYDKTKPLLTYSDLYYCDANLKVVANSYFKKINVSIKDMNYRCLIIANFVPGCSISFNHAFLTLIRPIKTINIMYDYWLVLFAALHAKIIYIEKPGLYYRRHNNTVTQSIGQSFLKKLLQVEYHKIVAQRAILILETMQVSSVEQRNFLYDIIKLPEKSRFARLLFCQQAQILPQKNQRKLKFLYRMCLT